ncbi:MAG: DUF4065 domain-containing protein [Bryobacterales bacterium]|nr:DUF4065 domain-containing protein [Bryobacterales bacterium]
MPSVHDVAAYVLERKGPMTAMKLQKLVYYCHSWSLVWDESPLFPEKIEAWANGPVVPELYAVHKGRFQLEPPWPKGSSTNLNALQRETVDAVLGFYGDKSSQWLSDLTHKETPWLNARKDAGPGEPTRNEISDAEIAEYYGSLYR